MGFVAGAPIGCALPGRRHRREGAVVGDTLKNETAKRDRIRIGFANWVKRRRKRDCDGVENGVNSGNTDAAFDGRDTINL